MAEPGPDEKREQVPRDQEAQDAGQHDKAEAAAATTGTALGCFTVALLPFSLAMLAALLLLILAFFRGCPSSGEWPAQPGPDTERPVPLEQS